MSCLSDVSLPLLVGALPGVAAIGGSLAARPEEGLLQSAAGSTLRVRLTADTWVDDLHSPAVFAALAAGVAADTDAARGWNRVVRSALNPSHLLRLDEATIEWRLPQFAGAAAVAVAEPADCAGDPADRVQPSPAPSPRP